MLAKEFVHKGRHIQRSLIIDFLHHVAHGNDLHLWISRLNVPQHIRKFLFNVLIFIQYQHIVHINWRLHPIKSIDKFRDTASDISLSEYAHCKAVIVGHSSIGAFNFCLGIQLEQAIIS